MHDAALAGVDTIEHAATVHAAEGLGSHGRDVGALASGKAADIVAVKGNPVDHVRRLEDVPFVMKGGAVVKGAFR